MIDASKFISKYEEYYFKETYKINESLGIKGVKATPKDEEIIIVDKLKKGIHDQDVIAWKMGSFMAGEKIDPTRIRGSHGKPFDMSKYLEQISRKQREIVDIIEVAMNRFNSIENKLDAVKELSDAFDIIKSCNTVSGFGTVYMINTMFFLSKGQIPIYDKNVYKAVQALYLDKKPIEINESDAPLAKDSVGAMFRLIEYMYLLDQVFGKGKVITSEKHGDCEHVGYISRGLDRALWVYGQCTEIYKEE